MNSKARSFTCLAVVWISLLIGPLAIACEESGDGPQAKLTAELVKAVSDKFDLKATKQNYKCGGSVVVFSFTPPIRVVGDENSPYKSWNQSLPIGRVAISSELNGNLKRLLNFSQEKIQHLKLAQALFVRDSLMINKVYELDVDFWPSKGSTSDAVVGISARYCKEGYFQSGAFLSKITVPVFSIEELLKDSDAPMYQAGDLQRAMHTSKDFVQALDVVTKSNLEADAYVKSRPDLYKTRTYAYCSESSSSEHGERQLFSWNKVRKAFALPEIR